ncbi:maleylpyruvate isomerase family mycothiol-dependent enzyme [Planosporangium sp. 12N6]|uniref:maleylpyruvate isomerase family mycothiol-dependent enzyme n=1 Tax=Planosporangium spinosum TaxID=3402278 RepID=UPI003CF53475
MPRTHADSLNWVEHGTQLLATQVAALDEPAMTEPSALPGWTRKHLVAHVAANADALGNLVHWARTGERTPMYSSMDQRNADIETGSTLPGAKLSAWLSGSARDLGTAMDTLTAEQWRYPVVTAQGRTVPATEIPWLRAREVCVHAIDLGTGLTFADLPDAFLRSLCGEVVAKRSASPAVAVVLEADGLRWELPGEGTPVTVCGPLPEITAYLTGRPHRLTTTDNAAAPDLPAWL